MKKIFTLLFSIAMLSTAFAQYGQNGRRDKHDDVYVSNGNPGYDKDYDRDRKEDYDLDCKGHGRGGYIFNAREKDMQIAQINREYAFRIQSVKNKYVMSWYQKKRIIINLDDQRDEEIFQVMRKFNSPKNKFGDYGRRNDNRW